MAVEGSKVKAALDVKYKGKSLSKDFKESFAKAAAELIENDEGIEEYINNHDTVINLTIAEADRRAQAAAAKAKAEAAEAVTGKKTDTDKDQPADDLPADTPAWAKAIIQEAKAARAEVAELKAARQTESIIDRFKKDERLKGIPETLLKGRIPTKDEDFEAAITETLADLKPLVEQFKLQDFGKDAPAAGVKQSAGNVKEATKEELDAVMPNLIK